MADKKRPNMNAQYIAEQRTVDVLRVLKELSDERHPISKKVILENVETTDNPQTLSNTICIIMSNYMILLLTAATPISS